MKVRVSKVMAKEIQKAMKERGYNVTVYVTTMTENAYVMNVGRNAMYDAMDNCDYDWAKNEFKIIAVEYGPNDYACPNYVTTRMLSNMFRNECPNKTLQELMEAVCHEIEI